MLDQLLQLLDLGMGAACFVMLVKNRIPARVTRLEKHLGLQPLDNKLAA